MTAVATGSHHQPRGRAARGAAAAATLTAWLAGCASISGSGEIFLPELPKSIELPAAEREHRRVLAEYGGAYEAPKLQAQLTKVLDRLVAASGRPNQAYKVTILNSPYINAFALPSRQLYVTRGMLALADDSAEFASVMAHEMAHVLARHAAIREEQVRKVELVMNVNATPGDPEAGAMEIARSRLALASFTRSQELEADGIGVRIAARSGYDAFGAARLLTAMRRDADLRQIIRGIDPRSQDVLTSYPSPLERAQNAENAARQLDPSNGAGERDKAAYLAGIDGLIYGENPIDGFVRGRRFLHPKLGFAFSAPEGFVLENTAQAVFGTKDGGAQALRLDAARVPAEQPLMDYLVSGWIENIDEGSKEALTVNGFAAVTATARGDQGWFRFYVIRLGAEVYRLVFIAKTRSPEADRGFREAVQSWRRLSAEEIQSIKPLRLKIVKVQPNDTVDALASRMAPTDHPVERFRILNGLEAGERPKPGDLVKLIVE